MSEVRTFFRHCPSCGRRFEIRLVSKVRIEDTEHVDERDGLLSPTKSGMITGPKPTPVPTVVHDAGPVTVDMEEFQYTYRCKHCGHQWSEVHEKTEVAPRSADYTGD